MVERRLRQRHLRSRREAASRQERENHMESQQGTRDFGEVLRHELNNPLTGILGNAELLLAELRRRNIELPQQAVLRLETIATLAVRMRETVRRLSEDWEAQSERAPEEFCRLIPAELAAIFFSRAIFVCQAVTVSVRRVFLSVCRGIREKLEYAAAKFIGLEAECPGMKCSRNKT